MDNESPGKEVTPDKGSHGQESLPIRHSQDITCSAFLSGVSLFLSLNLSPRPGSSWLQLAPGPHYIPQPQVLSATLNSDLWVQWLILSFISSRPWRRTPVPPVLISHGGPEVTVHRQVCGWHPRISHHHERKDPTGQNTIIPFVVWAMSAMNGVQSLGVNQLWLTTQPQIRFVYVCHQNGQLKPFNCNRESNSQKPKHTKYLFFFSLKDIWV